MSDISAFDVQCSAFSVYRPPQARDGPRLLLPRQRMLPNPQYPPPRLFQQPVHRPVPPLIPQNLLPPELRIILRPRRVDRTPMPETPVDKHHELLPRKNKIRFALEQMPPPPPRNLVRPKNRNQPQFGVLVPRTADAHLSLSRPVPRGARYRGPPAIHVCHESQRSFSSNDMPTHTITDPGYQHTAEIVKQAKAKGHDHAKIVRRLFGYERPFSLVADSNRAFDIFLAVAEHFRLPIHAVRAAGSGQLGYSFAKSKSFIPKSSDLDLAIVDSSLFSRYCYLAASATRDYRDLTTFKDTTTYQAFIEYMAKGYFRPDLMPQCNHKQLWFHFFQTLSKKHDAIYASINCGIYLSEEVFERKQSAEIERYLGTT